jgi:class 3 adenylate cyclase
MPLARELRKLAAIIAADVVGYSRLMGRDESGTLARLRKNRSEHLDPVLTKYGGRLVKLTGDGALVEFASAVDALSAAIEFQQAVAEANATSLPTSPSSSVWACTWAPDRRGRRSVRGWREHRRPP